MSPPISTTVIFELVFLVKVDTRLTISPNKCHFSVEIMILLARILKHKKTVRSWYGHGILHLKNLYLYCKYIENTCAPEAGFRNMTVVTPSDSHPIAAVRSSWPPYTSSRRGVDLKFKITLFTFPIPSNHSIYTLALFCFLLPITCIIVSNIARVAFYFRNDDILAVHSMKWISS